ncbi:VWA domain-containing protein [Ruficoccus amylovorans]|uniref:VWA domain-containing protein n=1 Tax=Ruficoccus amylovorans TaxID=1804625 RepID=A0A842HFW8_9BACT|nr:vWA domain-containing protein [Ruficoccus amylovorans]MBC2595565.1 VWA domain-containing protein [Ruficoccus amylovorans]
MLGFGQSLLLVALAGLALPLLAHLVNRARARPLRFPSVRFIGPSQLPRDKRRSLRDLLLLLLRLFFIALAVLALAQPVWTPPADSPLAATGEERTVIVLDASASMHGWGSWEEAQKAVKSLADTGNPTGLVIFDDEVLATVPVGSPARTLEQIVADLPPGERTGNPAPAIEAALRELGPDGPRKLILISDFQQSTWQSPAWPRLDEGVEVEAIQVGDFNRPNLAILDARAYPAPGGRLRVMARVRNDAETGQNVTIGLLHDGKTDSQALSFAPGQTQTVAFLIDQPEDQSGEITLPDDAYAGDNRFAVWLGAPAPAQVVALLPGPQEQEKLEEVAFVQKALSASGENMPPAFTVNGAAPDFNFSAVADLIDVLYLPATTAYLDEVQLELLRDYVAGGGVALITPGQAASRQFRLLRESGLTKTAFLGVPGRNRDQRDPFRIATLEPGSPLAEVFTGDSARDLYLAEIYQYVKLQPDANATVLLATEGGDPLLLRETYGKGELLISALSLDARWSDLPLRNAFLPVLRETLAQAVKADDTVIRLTVDEPLPADFPLPPGAVAPVVSAEPGVTALGPHMIQVNVARSESINQSTMLSDVRALMSSPAANASPSAAAPAGEGVAGRISLWPWLAAGALLCLLAELLLAAPRRRRPQGKAAHA